MQPEMYVNLFDASRIKPDRYTIAGIDPGETTGIAFADVFVVESKDLRGQSAKNVFVNLSGDSVKTSKYIPNLLLGRRADVWVIENFRLAPSRAKALSFNALKPVRVIGMLEYIAEINDIEIAFQTPSNIANVRPLTKPMRGWKTRHEHDAGSHALAYISKRENVPLGRLEVVTDELTTYVSD